MPAGVVAASSDCIVINAVREEALSLQCGQCYLSQPHWYRITAGVRETVSSGTYILIDIIFARRTE